MKHLLTIRGCILKPTCSEVLKRFAAFSNMVNGISRLSGGTTQCMMQSSNKGEFLRSGKKRVAKKNISAKKPAK